MRVRWLGLAMLSPLLACAGGLHAAPTTGTCELSFSADCSLAIDVPEALTMTETHGGDFTVYRFVEPETSNELGVYVGNFPDRFSGSLPDSGLRRHVGHIGTTRALWTTWTRDGRHHSETIVEPCLDAGPDPRAQSLLVHVFIAAATEADTRALEAVASTLRPLTDG